MVHHAGDLPCVFVTSSDRLEFAARAMRAGACDFLVKDERDSIGINPMPLFLRSGLSRPLVFPEQPRPRLQLRSTLVADTHVAGISVYGGTASILDSAILRTKAGTANTKSPSPGRAVLSYGMAGRLGELSLSNTVIRDTQGVAVQTSASDASVQRVLVAKTNSAYGRYGDGLFATDEEVDDHFERLRVAAKPGKLQVDHVHVRHCAGVGVVFQRASGTLTRSFIESCAVPVVLDGALPWVVSNQPNDEVVFGRALTPPPPPFLPRAAY